MLTLAVGVVAFGCGLYFHDKIVAKKEAFKAWLKETLDPLNRLT